MRMQRLCGSLIALALTGCAGVDARETAHTMRHAAAITVDDQTGGVRLGALNALQYTGRWERIGHRADGRVNGTSSRSFHRGDALQLDFVGTHLRIEGIAGPNGGRALVGVDNEPGHIVDFYAPQKRVRSVVWRWNETSPRYTHSLVLVVTGTHDAASRGDYVNIDDLRISEDGYPAEAASHIATQCLPFAFARYTALSAAPSSERTSLP